MLLQSSSRKVVPATIHWQEARVFHDTSHQRIMKCDADVPEERCTYVVFSGDTTMFPGFSEHMPTTLAPEMMQIMVICSSKV